MKDQGKNSPDLPNEEEIGSLPEKEFRVMIVKMIQNLGNRTEKIQETFNKDLEKLKSKQTVMNNKINEIKNSLALCPASPTVAGGRGEIWLPVDLNTCLQITKQDLLLATHWKKQVLIPLELCLANQRGNEKIPRNK